MQSLQWKLPWGLYLQVLLCVQSRSFKGAKMMIGQKLIGGWAWILHSLLNILSRWAWSVIDYHFLAWQKFHWDILKIHFYDSLLSSHFERGGVSLKKQFLQNKQLPFFLYLSQCGLKFKKHFFQWFATVRVVFNYVYLFFHNTLKLLDTLETL